MTDSMEPCKMLWADPCCHGNEIWARRGDQDAYRLVKQASTSEVFMTGELHSRKDSVINKCYC